LEEFSFAGKVHRGGEVQFVLQIGRVHRFAMEAWQFLFYENVFIV
jgi:hypothetical protein